MNIAVRAPASDLVAIAGIGHLVVAVADPAAAAAFYRDVLDFAPLGSDVVPRAGRHVALRAPSGQILALAAAEEAPPDLRDTGVHQAYRVVAARRDAVAAKLAAAGIEVHGYKEDRPAEEGDNFYFYDADGNRVQLAFGGPTGIDHAAIVVADVLRAEQFYGDILGLPVEHRVGWRTADYVRARKWAAGEEDMAPGARRLDKRYTVMVNRKTVPRVNMQVYFRAGGACLAIYLANQHFQEPPEETSVGLPRIGFAVREAALDDLARRFEAARHPALGPISHGASSPLIASLYVRDPGGNFIEFCAPRVITAG